MVYCIVYYYAYIMEYGDIYCFLFYDVVCVIIITHTHTKREREQKTS